jgi:hypothetical protein
VLEQLKLVEQQLEREREQQLDKLQPAVSGRQLDFRRRWLGELP